MTLIHWRNSIFLGRWSQGTYRPGRRGSRHEGGVAMRPPGNRPAVPGQRWRPGRAGAAAVAGSLLLGLVATGAVAQSARDGDTGAVHVPAPMTAPEVVATAEVEEATDP